ncbi:hypothetical protein GCM10020255_070860 [Rhodococcus baikonurensis]
MLRVVQESLTNVMKHGDKKGLVSVSVRRDDNRVDVRVVNDVEDRPGMQVMAWWECRSARSWSAAR